jgi:hypothetical protein
MEPKSQPNSPAPGLITEIEQAQNLAQKTGMRIVKRLDKTKFLEEFPQAAFDPRMALTPQSFNLEFASFTGLTVGELRNMCLRVKSHPLALQKVLQVEGHPDNTTVFILQEEFNILQNAQEKEPSFIIQGAAPAPAPATPPAPPPSTPWVPPTS